MPRNEKNDCHERCCDNQHRHFLLHASRFIKKEGFYKNIHTVPNQRARCKAIFGGHVFVRSFMVMGIAKFGVLR
jgi:hypothetical protein